MSEQDRATQIPSDYDLTTDSSRFLSPQQPTKKLTLLESQSANEKELICDSLRETNGNAAKAARLLGLSPQSFHYKIKKYQIDKKKFAADPFGKQ
ncbi:MAG: hypothetical protein HQK62_06690 [Desulfamplus sp.]|nr:hypothetical protein [Desulfamplus sp.]